MLSGFISAASLWWYASGIWCALQPGCGQLPPRHHATPAFPLCTTTSHIRQSAVAAPIPLRLLQPPRQPHHHQLLHSTPILAGSHHFPHHHPQVTATARVPPPVRHHRLTHCTHVPASPASITGSISIVRAARGADAGAKNRFLNERSHSRQPESAGQLSDGAIRPVSGHIQVVGVSDTPSNTSPLFCACPARYKVYEWRPQSH